MFSWRRTTSSRRFSPGERENKLIDVISSDRSLEGLEIIMHLAATAHIKLVMIVGKGDNAGGIELDGGVFTEVDRHLETFPQLLIVVAVNGGAVRQEFDIHRLHVLERLVTQPVDFIDGKAAVAQAENGGGIVVDVELAEAERPAALAGLDAIRVGEFVNVGGGTVQLVG